MCGDPTHFYILLISKGIAFLPGGRPYYILGIFRSAWCSSALLILQILLAFVSLLLFEYAKQSCVIIVTSMKQNNKKNTVSLQMFQLFSAAIHMLFWISVESHCYWLIIVIYSCFSGCWLVNIYHQQQRKTFLFCISSQELAS